MKTTNYLKYYLMAAILSVMTGCQTSIVKESQSDIDSISHRLVPDHRLGICNIKLEALDSHTLILTGETTSREAESEILKALNKYHIKLIDSIIILPDTIKNIRFLGLADLSVINLRKDPDHASELVSQCRLGTPLKILKDDDYWLLVQTPDGYVAWTERTSVQMMNRVEMNNWRKSDRIVYIANSGWIHNEPKGDSIVSDVVAGDIMQKARESKGSVNVIFPDGRTGWVDKKATVEFNTFRDQGPPEAQGIIALATSLFGVPYLWGGASSKGVDCSGFVQTVFFMNGLILQRDASLQALHGIPIDLSKGFNKLEKCDLLFFGARDKSGQHVSHVAIYLGKNQFINASGRVMINSLDSADSNFSRYRLYTLLSARRILGAKYDDGIVPLKNHTWY